MKLKRPSAYWAELDEKRRSEYRIVAAVLLGIFTLFTAIAVVSYLFTWKQDASLLTGASLTGSEVPVSNASSKLGFRWGHFLVTRSFGLAAFGLVAFFVAWTLSRAVPRLRIPLGKWFVYSFTGTFIGSWLLALLSRLAGWETLFGGGIGGRAGGALVNACIDLVGFVITALALLALAGLWVFFLRGGLPAAAGEEEEPVVRQARQPVPDPVPAPVEGPKPEPKPEPVVRQAHQPVPEPKPQPVPELKSQPVPEQVEEIPGQAGNDEKEPVPEPVGEHVVLYSDIDIIGHTNNARYMVWAMDCLDYETVSTRRVRDVYVNFNKETTPGSTVQLFRLKTEENGALVWYVEGRVDGKTAFCVKLVF